MRDKTALIELAEIDTVAIHRHLLRVNDSVDEHATAVAISDIARILCILEARIALIEKSGDPPKGAPA